MFKSLKHFEFIFVYVYSHFIDFHWLSNFPNTPC